MRENSAPKNNSYFKSKSLITNEHLNQFDLSYEQDLQERRIRNGLKVRDETWPVTGNNKLSTLFYNATYHTLHSGAYLVASAMLGNTIGIGIEIYGGHNGSGTNIMLISALTMLIGAGELAASLALGRTAVIFDQFGAEDTNTIKRSYLERQLDELKEKDQALNSETPTPDDALLKQAIHKAKYDNSQNQEHQVGSSSSNTAAISISM